MKMKIFRSLIEWVMGFLGDYSSILVWEVNYLEWLKKDEEDRLSNLPDDILHQIFYLAGGTIKLVEASTFNSKWRHVWKSSPFLHLDTADLSFSIKNWLMLLWDGKDQDYRLDAFINNFMKYRDNRSPILKFRISKFDRSIFVEVALTEAGSFIDHLKANYPAVQEIEVFYRHPLDIDKGAQTLRLLSSNLHPQPQPQLKCPYLLHTVEFSGMTSFWNYCYFQRLRNLFTTENLLFSDCEFHGGSCIEMSSLKVRLIISTPSLVTFDFRQIHGGIMIFKDLSSLSNALVDVSVLDRYNVFMLLSNCFNVTTLTISSAVFECLNLGEHCIRFFRNLEHVVVMFETSVQPLQMTEYLQYRWLKLKTLEGKCKWRLNFFIAVKYTEEIVRRFSD